MESPPTHLAVLSEVEQSCLQRYVATLVETLGNNLDELVLFGSVARGELWPQGMPIRSDLDLLVVTFFAVTDETQSALLDATFPLFLECGRQIGPQFRTREQVDNPADERTAAFYTNIERDGIHLYRRTRAENRGS